MSEIKRVREDDLKCTCYRVRKAARALTRLYDDTLANTGLTSTQMSVLVELSRSPNSSVTDLGTRLGMDRTTMSRIVKPMLAKGWVEGPRGQDRRARDLLITSSGEQTLSSAMSGWSHAETIMLRGLGNEKRALLFELLEEIGDLALGEDKAA